MMLIRIAHCSLHFLASMYQMTVLLLFNQSLDWTVKQIQDETEIEIELLRRVLRSLLNWKLLACSPLKDKEFEESDIEMNHKIQLANEFES